MSKKDDNQKKIRDKHNEDILKRLKKGESLKSFDSYSSWFPPRPIIEKDKKALELIHKEKRQDSEEELTPLVSIHRDEENTSESSDK